MKMSLRDQFNRLATTVIYQKHFGANVLEQLISDEEVKEETIKKVFEKGAYDLQRAGKIMAAAYDIDKNPPQDDRGFSNAILVYKELLEMGDANIGLMAEVIGEEKVKEALPEKNKDVAKDVAKSLKLKNMQKLLG